MKRYTQADDEQSNETAQKSEHTEEEEVSVTPED